MTGEFLGAMVSIVAVLLLVPMAHAALWFVLDGSEAEKIRRLFQPRWRREADYLARNIPHGDGWL